jgi:glycosyltransferase involved in cell wall biosynthesis
MRILFVSGYLPSRVAGAQVRFLGLLSCLARSHEVSLLSFVPPKADNAAVLESVRGYCETVVTVPNDRLGSQGASKRALQLRSVLSSRSRLQMFHEHHSFQLALDDLAARSRYDVVQVEGCYMAHYAFPRGSAVVLDEHNIEYEIYRRSSSISRALPRKLYNLLDYAKLRTEEQRSWRTVDAVAVTSLRDHAVVRECVPDARVAVVPNAVDLDFFSSTESRTEASTLLFFGAMNYYPNVDAIVYFLREVMPLLKRSHPTLKLVIVGSLPPPEVQRWAGADVVVTGAVDDVRPYLHRARGVVVPLRVGGGTRLKILEAMAMGKAVVSTAVGAEGLAVTDGHDILLANDAESFAVQTRRVLDDDALVGRLGAAARRLVESDYQWKASARKLEALYAAAMAGPHRGRALGAPGALRDQHSR